MIAPTKHVPLDRALLGVGALLLAHMDRTVTTSRLWETVRDREELASYEVFTLTLSFLFAIGAVESDGKIVRKVRA